MNKFEQLISANSNSTLKRRAGIISNEAKMAQDEIIATITRALNQENLNLLILLLLKLQVYSQVILNKVVLQNGHKNYKSVRKIFII